VSWLVHEPLFVLVLTLAAYQLGRWLRRRTGGHALAQPVLVAVVVVGVAITLLDVDYAEYRDGTRLIAFWLGPATVALAVPLHRHGHRLRRMALPIAAAIPLGAVVSIAGGILLVGALGAGETLQRTMAPKATTTPVSIALSETIGGLPPLTAALTIVAGTLGAVAGPAVMSLLRIREPHARGLALGSVSHGIGTSRALRESSLEGAFAGLAMGLTALATSLLLPLLVRLLL
jgi:predicted murein hydrolase (TIGR00659 family)